MAGSHVEKELFLHTSHVLRPIFFGLMYWKTNLSANPGSNQFYQQLKTIFLFFYFYRPQRSCGQGNIFAPVCHSVHGGVSASPHPRSRHPPEQTPPGTDTPQNRYPPQKQTSPEQTPPRADTPRADTTPQEADSGIRSMSGRYASYWNAFLSFYLDLNPLILYISLMTRMIPPKETSVEYVSFYWPGGNHSIRSTYWLNSGCWLHLLTLVLCSITILWD